MNPAMRWSFAFSHMPHCRSGSAPHATLLSSASFPCAPLTSRQIVRGGGRTHRDRIHMYHPSSRFASDESSAPAHSAEPIGRGLGAGLPAYAVAAVVLRATAPASIPMGRS